MWTCSECATRHETEEGRIACRRRSRRERAVVFGVFGFIIGMLFAAKIIYAEIVYDDWTCAVANCMKVK